MFVLDTEPKKKTKNDCWKRDFFDKVQNIEEAKYSIHAEISTLKKYNLILRNIQIERELCKYSSLGVKNIKLLNFNVICDFMIFYQRWQQRISHG